MNRAVSNRLEAEIESKGEVPAGPPYLLSPHDNFLASYAELHNRPFPVLATPLCVSHITLMNDDSAERSKAPGASKRALRSLQCDSTFRG